MDTAPPASRWVGTGTCTLLGGGCVVAVRVMAGRPDSVRSAVASPTRPAMRLAAAPGHLQHPAAGAGRRPAHRRAVPDGELQEHRPDFHLQPRHQRHLQGGRARLHQRARCRLQLRPDEAEGHRRTEEALPPGVPQPHRRHRGVPSAHHRADRADGRPDDHPGRDGDAQQGHGNRDHREGQAAARQAGFRPRARCPTAAPHHSTRDRGPTVGEDPVRTDPARPAVVIDVAGWTATVPGKMPHSPSAARPSPVLSPKPHRSPGQGHRNRLHRPGVRTSVR